MDTPSRPPNAIDGASGAAPAPHCVALFVNDPVDRRLLAEFLCALGHQVHVPERFDAARIPAATTLVMVDERTASRHGSAVMQVRWRSSIAFLPIVILLPLRASAVQLLKQGYDDVLRLPISKDELRARLVVFSRFRAQSEQYRTLFENALIGIYRVEPSGKLLMANPAMVERLGYGALDELAVDGLRDRRVEPSHERFCALVAERGTVAGMETLWRRRDGAALYALENARAVREGGGLAYIEGSIEDIGTRKRAETEREQLLRRAEAARAEAETASRLKDDFLATLSHELRTPLTAIVGWASLLRAGTLPADSVPTALEVIERQARTQAQLIEDLLDVSRIITGKLRLDPKWIDPVIAVTDGLEAVRPSAQAKGVRIATELAADAGLVFGDAARLQQIVWNLLSNAVKFTPAQGEVGVRVRRLGETLEIRVNDTGEGIDPAFLPFVFDRFRQHDGSITRKHQGLGLGLAIVRHLVELHGGTVEAASPGLGQGATFTVRLPVGAEKDFEPSRAGAAGAMRSAPAAELSDVDVLLVDDDADARDVLRAILAKAGANVMTAQSAGEALAMLHIAPADVLISDISMPDADGYALIRQVRTELGLSVPAAALTAAASPEDRALALDAGYDRHVAKPVEPAALIAAVAELARRRNAGTTIEPDGHPRR